MKDCLLPIQLTSSTTLRICQEVCFNLYLYTIQSWSRLTDTAPVDQGHVRQILGELLARMSDGCWPRAKTRSWHPSPNLRCLSWFQQLLTSLPFHEQISILTLLLNPGTSRIGMPIPWWRGPWHLLHPTKIHWHHRTWAWIQQDVPQTSTPQSLLWVFILPI